MDLGAREPHVAGPQPSRRARNVHVWVRIPRRGLMIPTELADLQSSESRQQIALDAVGISGLRHPVVVLDRLRAKQGTVASLTMAVDLAASQRGAPLSRFLEVLSDAESELTVRTAQNLLGAITTQLGATTATIDAEFPYFIEK